METKIAKVNDANFKLTFLTFNITTAANANNVTACLLGKENPEGQSAFPTHGLGRCAIIFTASDTPAETIIVGTKTNTNHTTLHLLKKFGEITKVARMRRIIPPHILKSPIVEITCQNSVMDTMIVIWIHWT